MFADYHQIHNLFQRRILRHAHSVPNYPHIRTPKLLATRLGNNMGRLDRPDRHVHQCEAGLRFARIPRSVRKQRMARNDDSFQ